MVNFIKTKLLTNETLFIAIHMGAHNMKSHW
jgi:hypothetical protein